MEDLDGVTLPQQGVAPGEAEQAQHAMGRFRAKPQL